MNKTWIRVATSLAVAAMLAGCASKPSVPPVTTVDSSTPKPGKFVWYDLLTEDLPAVKTFYGELLDWTFDDTAVQNYTLIRHRGRAIGGIIDVSSERPEINESQWISLLSVPDVDQAVQSASRLGAEVHVKPRNLPGRGRIAVVSDPQGAIVALLKSSTGDPPDGAAESGDWMWTELWTGDVDGSTAFYGELVGFKPDDRVILEDYEYKIFTRDDVPRAGVIPRPIDDVRAHWLPYVRVEDPAALADRVEGLGGKVVLDPRKDVREGTVAIVLDPSGAALALQYWPES